MWSKGKKRPAMDTPARYSATSPHPPPAVAARTVVQPEQVWVENFVARVRGCLGTCTRALGRRGILEPLLCCALACHAGRCHILCSSHALWRGFLHQNPQAPFLLHTALRGETSLVQVSTREPWLPCCGKSSELCIVACGAVSRSRIHGFGAPAHWAQSTKTLSQILQTPRTKTPIRCLHSLVNPLHGVACLRHAQFLAAPRSDFRSWDRNTCTMAAEEGSPEQLRDRAKAQGVYMFGSSE